VCIRKIRSEIEILLREIGWRRDPLGWIGLDGRRFR
jgi:hypothetical protein